MKSHSYRQKIGLVVIAVVLYFSVACQQQISVANAEKQPRLSAEEAVSKADSDNNSSGAGENQAVVSTIKSVDFCNFTFKNSFGKDSHCFSDINEDVAQRGEITVAQCEYVIKPSQSSHSAFDYKFSVEDINGNSTLNNTPPQILYGDLTRDGQDEAIVRVGCSAPGLWGEKHEEAYVFALVNGKASAVGLIDWGSQTMGGFKHFEIKNNSLYVDRNYNKNAMNNADNPTHLLEQIYKWNGRKLNLTSSKKRTLARNH